MEQRMPKILATNQWLSKIVAADAELLDKIAHCPRLESLVMRGWRLTRPGKPTEVAMVVPKGREAQPWKEAILIGEGLKLGGRKALSAAGVPVFKGLNIFPGGLKGEPVGHWDGDASKLLSAKIYIYRSLFVPGALFAARKIVQLPSIYRVTGDEVFQNSTIMIQLTRYLPIDKWTMSRPIQWFAAKTMRAGVIEDLGGTWMGREYLRLPVPAEATEGQLATLEQAGSALTTADEDLADARRHVRAAIDGAPSATLRSLIVRGDARTDGFDLGTASAGVIPVSNVRVEGEAIVGDDLLLRILVPNRDLRTYLAYALAEKASERDDLEMDASDMLALRVPNDMATVVAEIHRWMRGNREEHFKQAHRDLDLACGAILGLTDAEVDWIIGQMASDPFLSELRPMYAHRGFRQQPYSDRVGRNMYR